MKYLLFKDAISIKATNEDTYAMVVNVSTGALGYEGIKDWLLNHTQTK